MTKFASYSGSRVDLIKGMESGSSFELENMVPEMVEYRGYTKPRLLTNLLSPSVERMMDNVFKYDEGISTAALMDGKRFDDIGKTTKKDDVKQHLFRIGSRGGQYSIKNRDVKNKRIPGTTEPMTHEYLIAREQNRLMDGIDLLNELNLAKLITSDTMLSNDFFTSPNFYTEITGGARDPAQAMNLAGTDLPTYRSAIEDKIDAITEEADKYGRSITGWVMVCGKNYFNGVRALEEQENLAREIRGIDLIQEGTPVLSDGEFSNLRFLDGSDGVRYIKYTGSILSGQKLIADDAAYLIPLGVESMIYMAYAPTDRDFELCTQEARPFYMWSEQNRHGYHFEMESNCLYGNKLPQLISHFSASA